MWRSDGETFQPVSTTLSRIPPGRLATVFVFLYGDSQRLARRGCEEVDSVRTPSGGMATFPYRMWTESLWLRGNFGCPMVVFSCGLAVGRYDSPRAEGPASASRRR